MLLAQNLLELVHQAVCGVPTMFGSSLMKWLLVVLLFIVLPIVLMRYMVLKTIKVVHRTER
jgi:hypothetical protein